MEYKEKTVVRIAPDIPPADASMLLVAALIASAGPEVAQRAETMLSLMAAVDPTITPHIAQAKRLAINARRIADAVSGQVESGVPHERIARQFHQPHCAMG